MSFSKFAAIGALASLAAMVPQVQAHGTVTGLVVDGTYYTGFLVDTYNYETDPPASIGWSEDATDNGYVSDYSSADIICHKNATNGQLSATIAAGKDITFEWSTWPSSHHGPVITYLANCGDSCETVDKTTLEFVKFDATGLVDDTTVPGTWASDELIANNNSWTVTVPSSLAAGNYVLRHEIIALHSAEEANGAQNYPQCINIEVTGSGTEAPTGTLGEDLYTATDAGILVNIYESLTYTIPGPAIPSAFASDSSSSGSSSSTASSVAASTSAVATSSVASSSAVETSSAASSVVATTSSVAVVASTTAASSTVVATSSAASVATSSVAASSATTAAVSTTTPATTTTAAVSSAVASSVASAISSLETDLPSSVLTSAAPTATATTSSGSTVSTAGLTVAELLDLLKQILVQLFASSSSSSKARRHARDITA